MKVWMPGFRTSLLRTGENKGPERVRASVHYSSVIAGRKQEPRCARR
jgi:hypothetical protein